MRRTLFASYMLSALLVCSCGGDDPPTFAELKYQVRCPVNPLAGCSRDGEQVDVFGYDGEPNDPQGSPEGSVSVSCDFSHNGDSRDFSFSVMVGSGAEAPSVRLFGATVNDAGVVGGDCRLRVKDVTNTYEGACSSNPPSPEIPCQLGTVNLAEGEDGPEVTTTILCQDITAATNPTQLRRDVEAGVPFPRETPASVRLIRCTGT